MMAKREKMLTKIFDFLYLGSEYDLDMYPKKEFIVVNVLEDPDIESDYNMPILYKKQNKYLLDWNQVIMVTDKIEKLRIENPNKKIALVCGAGQEKSPLVCQYYIVRYNDFGTDDAFNFIKAKRPEIIRCDKDYKW